MRSGCCVTWLVLASVLSAVAHDADATRELKPRSGPFWNGEELQRRLSIGRPWKQLTAYEERANLEGLTYLWGVADTIEGTSACIIGSPNEYAMTNLVLNYMYKNSAKLQSPAAELVKGALSESFPCPAQSRTNPSEA